MMLTHMVAREGWRAMEPRGEMDALNTPMQQVLFIHTDTESCTTHEECSSIVRRIQEEHMSDEVEVPDIMHSFLIGGNGWVYEDTVRSMVGPTNNASIRDVTKENPEMFIIPRKTWGAHPPLKELPALPRPVGSVRFTHTRTDSCASHEECKKVLRNLQFEQIENLDHADISYNFMIGAEGYVYEGRGWTVEPDRPSVYGELAMGGLEIAYIGDYEDNAPPQALIRAAMELIVYGMKNSLISHYFEGFHLT